MDSPGPGPLATSPPPQPQPQPLAPASVPPPASTAAPASDERPVPPPPPAGDGLTASLSPSAAPPTAPETAAPTASSASPPPRTDPELEFSLDAPRRASRGRPRKAAAPSTATAALAMAASSLGPPSIHVPLPDGAPPPVAALPVADSSSPAPSPAPQQAGRDPPALPPDVVGVLQSIEQALQHCASDQERARVLQRTLRARAALGQASLPGQGGSPFTQTQMGHHFPQYAHQMQQAVSSKSDGGTPPAATGPDPGAAPPSPSLAAPPASNPATTSAPTSAVPAPQAVPAPAGMTPGPEQTAPSLPPPPEAGSTSGAAGAAAAGSSTPPVPETWISNMITGHREGAAACDRCRSQKLKCDKKMPCGRCHRLKHQCTRNDVLMRRGPPTRLQREIFKHIGLEYRTFRDRLAEKREARLLALGIGPDGRPLPGTGAPSSDQGTSMEEQARLAAAAAALANRSAPSLDKNRSGARFQLHVPAYVAAKHKAEARQAALQAGIQAPASSSSAQPSGQHSQPHAQPHSQPQSQSQPQPRPTALPNLENQEHSPDQAAVAAAAAAAAAAFLPSSNHSYPFGVLNSDDLHAFVQGYAEAAAAQAQAPPQEQEQGEQPPPPPPPPPAQEGTFNPDFYTTVADNADREAGEERDDAVHTAPAEQAQGNAPNRVYGRFPHPHPTPARPHAWARRPVLAQQETGAMSLADAVGATSRANSPLPEAPNTNEAAIEALLLLRDHGHAGEAEAQEDAPADPDAATQQDTAQDVPSIPDSAAPAPLLPDGTLEPVAEPGPVLPPVPGHEAAEQAGQPPEQAGATGPPEAGAAAAWHDAPDWHDAPAPAGQDGAQEQEGAKRAREELEAEDGGVDKRQKTD